MSVFVAADELAAWLSTIDVGDPGILAVAGFLDEWAAKGIEPRLAIVPLLKVTADAATSTPKPPPAREPLERSAFGTFGQLVKLTDADVVTIRGLARRGMPVARIAARFGVTVGYVRCIVAGRERRGASHPARRGSVATSPRTSSSARSAASGEIPASAAA